MEKSAEKFKKIFLKVMQRFDGKTKEKKARENSTQCDMAERSSSSRVLTIGQLISKGLFGVIVLTKKPRKF